MSDFAPPNSSYVLLSRTSKSRFRSKSTGPIKSIVSSTSRCLIISSSTVSQAKDGDELISSSQHFISSSIITSNPYKSKQHGLYYMSFCAATRALRQTDLIYYQMVVSQSILKSSLNVFLSVAKDTFEPPYILSVASQS